MKRNFHVKHLSPLGPSEIIGLDVGNALDQDSVDEIRSLWNASGGILVFRDQDLSPEQHIAFSRYFGPLFGGPEGVPLQDTVSRYIHPDYPEIYRVSNRVDDDGKPLGRARAGTYWHSDVSFREQPASASVLYAKQIPDVGGDTLFANTQAAYEDLSQTLKETLAPLHAVHDFAVAAATQYAKPIVIDDDFDGTNQAIHPVVRTHPDTGDKSLFVNPGFTSHLQNFSADESASILGYLYEHITKPEYIYRHCWQENDLLMWDNRINSHYAIANYGDTPRYLERTTVIGERPR